MKKMRILPIVLCFILISTLFGCNSTESNIPEHNVEVTFKLENGIYKNSKLDVKHYYLFKDDEKRLIYPLSDFVKTDDELSMSGYYLEGWYQVKNDDGTYSSKWDFENDLVTGEEITLYANWVKEVHYSYDLVFIDETGTEVELGKYNVDEGAKFKDYLGYADRNYGYTRMSFLESGGFTDEDGNPWDENYTHPGESKAIVKVYVKYLYGDFSIVSTASELKAATNKSIYLLNDIDLNGDSLSFGNYKYTFLGNGHTISNFTISYQADKSALKEDLTDSSMQSLYISLFGDVKGADIENVTFENVTVNIQTLLKTTYKIYVSPLCSSLTSTKLENIKFTGTYNIVKLPTTMTFDQVVVDTNGYFKTDEESVLSNNTIIFIKGE